MIRTTCAFSCALIVGMHLGAPWGWALLFFMIAMAPPGHPPQPESRLRKLLKSQNTEQEREP